MPDSALKRRRQQSDPDVPARRDDRSSRLAVDEGTPALHSASSILSVLGALLGTRHWSSETPAAAPTWPLPLGPKDQGAFANLLGNLKRFPRDGPPSRMSGYRQSAPGAASPSRARAARSNGPGAELNSLMSAWPKASDRRLPAHADVLLGDLHQGQQIGAVAAGLSRRGGFCDGRRHGAQRHLRLVGIELWQQRRQGARSRLGGPRVGVLPPSRGPDIGRLAERSLSLRSGANTSMARLSAKPTPTGAYPPRFCRAYDPAELIASQFDRLRPKVISKHAYHFGEQPQLLIGELRFFLSRPSC